MKWRLTFVAIVALCYACIAWIPLQEKPKITVPTATSEFVWAEASPQCGPGASDTPNAIQLSINPAFTKRKLYIFAQGTNPAHAINFSASGKFSRSSQVVFTFPCPGLFSNTSPFATAHVPSFQSVTTLGDNTGNFAVTSPDCIVLMNPTVGKATALLSPFYLTIDADLLAIDVHSITTAPDTGAIIFWVGVYSEAP